MMSQNRQSRSTRHASTLPHQRRPSSKSNCAQQDRCPRSRDRQLLDIVQLSATLRPSSSRLRQQRRKSARHQPPCGALTSTVVDVEFRVAETALWAGEDSLSISTRIQVVPAGSLALLQSPRAKRWRLQRIFALSRDNPPTGRQCCGRPDAEIMPTVPLSANAGLASHDGGVLGMRETGSCGQPSCHCPRRAGAGACRRVVHDKPTGCPLWQPPPSSDAPLHSTGLPMPRSCCQTRLCFATSPPSRRFALRRQATLRFAGRG